MALTNFLVILMIISVGLACAEKSEQTTPNTNTTATSHTNSTEDSKPKVPENSGLGTSNTNSTGASDNGSTEDSKTKAPENLGSNTNSKAENGSSPDTKAADVYCVAVNFTLQLNDNGTSGRKFFISTLGNKIKPDYDCGKSKQSATIPWGNESTILFHFGQVQAANYTLSSISLTVAAADNINTTVKDAMSYKHPHDIEIPIGFSYNFCTKVITLEGASSNATISNLQFEAFRKDVTTPTVFGNSTVKCDEKTIATTNTNPTTTESEAPVKSATLEGSTIAIIVTCSLLLLFAVMGVSYVIWRKRNNSSIFGACTR